MLLIHLARRCRIRTVSRNPLYCSFFLLFQWSQVLLIIAVAEVRRRRDLSGVCIPLHCQKPQAMALNPWGVREAAVPAVPIPVGTATSHPLVKEWQNPTP